MPAKILIVDDHEVVREGVRTLINRERPQWEVCGEAKSAPEALEACRGLKPNVTVLDITMPGMSGLEVASSMFELGSRVLMFTMHESEHLASEVSRAGAQGFVLKSQASQDLIRAIESLLGGGTFFGSEPDPEGNTHTSSGEPGLQKLGQPRRRDGNIPLFNAEWPGERNAGGLAVTPSPSTRKSIGRQKMWRLLCLPLPTLSR